MRKRSKGLEIFSMSALDLFAAAMGAFVLIALIALPYYKKEIPDLLSKVSVLSEELTQKDAQIAAQTAEIEQQKAEIAQQAAEIVAQELQIAQQSVRIEELDAGLKTAEAMAKELQEEIAQQAGQIAELKGSLESAQSEAQEQMEMNAFLEQQANENASREQQCRQQLSDAQAESENCRQQLRKKFVLVVMSWDTDADIDLHVVDPQQREYYYGAKRFGGSPAELEVDNTDGPGNEIWLHPSATPGEYKIYYKYFSKYTEDNTTVRGLVLYQENKHEIPDRTLTREGEKMYIATIYVDEEGNVQVNF